MLNLLGTIAQTTDNASSGGAAVIVGVIYLALAVLFCVGYWKVFTKLGLPGWMGIVPFVNVYMIFKVRGQRSPVLWLILFFIPCINIIAAWFLADDTAELFDKELGWKICLFLFPGISHLVLGFGESTANPAKMAAGEGLNKGFAA